MMFAISLRQASLSDQPPASAIAAAADWMSGLLFGPLATAIAVIAIAWVGLAMLSGRVDIRRGASVLLGCFLLFGAKGIADGLLNSASYEVSPSVAAVTAPPQYLRPLPQNGNANAFDPYAGAAVMRSRQ